MDQKKVEFNVRAHNRVAKKYESRHGEIYNYREQNRLEKDLREAILTINTGSKKKKAIDFGCGAGNLTRHLSNLGLDVLSADISKGFLDLINSQDYSTKVETIQLNGDDISNVQDNSVDMIATYSVLHHIPDYLAIIKEFIRVVKPGGVIYIDHESSEFRWAESPQLKDFYKRMRKSRKGINKNLFIFNNYVDFVIRKLINPRYRREGDIHVFHDDHIEWDKIENVVNSNGAKVKIKKDYLLFRDYYDEEAYNRSQNVLNDMSLMIIVVL